MRMRPVHGTLVSGHSAPGPSPARAYKDCISLPEENDAVASQATQGHLAIAIGTGTRRIPAPRLAIE